MNEEILNALNALNTENLKSEHDKLDDYDELDDYIAELGSSLELEDRLDKVNNKLKSLLGEYEKTLELIEAHERHKSRAEKLRGFIKEAIDRKKETMFQLSTVRSALYFT